MSQIIEKYLELNL